MLELKIYYELSPAIKVRQGELLQHDDYQTKKESSNKRVKEATRDILSYVTNLDTNYGAIIFPKQEYTKFTFPNEKNQTPKFHRDLKFEYLQLDYDPKNSVATRNETVEKMYNAIDFAIESLHKQQLINR